MSMLSLRQVSFTWAGPLLLDGVEFEIEQGERIGLLGRNGSGKSTLMKLLAGEIEPDAGEIRRAKGIRVARLIQEVPQSLNGSVAEVVADECQRSVDEHEDPQEMWRVHQDTERMLQQMKLDGSDVFGTLSSGMKRRVLLARALVGHPDVLLLDEPTNHLDVTSISELERFLQKFGNTLIFVTHDRSFLEALATRIVEIDRGRLFNWTCDYKTFLQRKQAALETEEKEFRQFDRKLAQEETWIRQGIKARRTRNEGRVRALKRMREEHQQRRRQTGNVRLKAATAERSGQLVVETKQVSFAYGEQPIVQNLSVLITRGDKIGIIGPNGSGKTTLLKILLGELEPSGGSIRHGTRLEVLYFDQLREQLDEDQTVVENVGEGQEMLLINGKQKHIYGYLQDFLFTPERARQPARFLSGGERNRLLLARLFKRPSNTLVLDEPTNDLDIETLELLEELVSDYAGTLLLVSHDRAFLNNVVTSTMALDGSGRVSEYAGGYDDYVLQCNTAVTTFGQAEKSAKKGGLAKVVSAERVRLSYHEQRELESLPQRIERLERRRDEQHTVMADPSFYKQDGSQISRAAASLETMEQELAQLFSRWEELEARSEL